MREDGIRERKRSWGFLLFSVLIRVFNPHYCFDFSVEGSAAMTQLTGHFKACSLYCLLRRYPVMSYGRQCACNHCSSLLIYLLPVCYMLHCMLSWPLRLCLLPHDITLLSCRRQLLQAKSTAVDTNYFHCRLIRWLFSRSVKFSRICTKMFSSVSQRSRWCPQMSWY